MHQELYTPLLQNLKHTQEKHTNQWQMPVIVKAVVGKCQSLSSQRFANASHHQGSGWQVLVIVKAVVGKCQSLSRQCLANASHRQGSGWQMPVIVKAVIGKCQSSSRQWLENASHRQVSGMSKTQTKKKDCVHNEYEGGSILADFSTAVLVVGESEDSHFNGNGTKILFICRFKMFGFDMFVRGIHT